MILVTGVNGLIGSTVIHEFARQGYPVRALVRNRVKAQVLEALSGVEVVEGDMLRPETLGHALDGVDRALLISSPNQQMVQAQCTFIDAAKKAGARHIIKLSGVTTSLDSPFLFSRMHAEISDYLEHSGLAWTFLRPSQFATEYLREVPTIITERALYLPFEDGKLTPVDLEDVAKAAFTLLTTPGHEGKAYMMSGPHALSMTEIAEQISLAIGESVRYVSIPVEERHQAQLVAGIPDYVADALDVQSKLRQKGNGEEVVHLETHTALGIRPAPFAEFARRHAADFLGTSEWGMAQKERKNPLSLRDLTLV
ncbi:NAD(P)-dependent oxidoreductase [Ktedonobacter sp. SOSP1-52]|uniref:SDR family oxidoreductase n=1 Tax=Ktedonobacter sp. SOSP1-52 TaxID=2778366 RepID=UPI001915DDEB|nr:SDR family oxidoreductase [Ktedonobacter sp. SOSP1-52]GHO63243.1 NAD(P)-dependent oxidoreductase [Ktedonobacter sp. SOSP1-52]